LVGADDVDRKLWLACDLMLKLVIFGPPGSGKGTYASRLAKKLGVPHISTGELVRDEIRNKTLLGTIVEKYSNSGTLVPDEVITEILKNRISAETSKAFILEGYPRTVSQAKALEKITELDAVVYLDVPDNVIIARLSARLQCKACGEIYNERTLKPKVPGKCDRCGNELFRRADDQPQVIRERVRVYKEASEPVVAFYRAKGLLKNIGNHNESVPPDLVVERIITTIS
jgi:adenylate kinase